MSVSLHANELISYLFTWCMYPNLQPVHTSTAGQSKSQEPSWLVCLSLEEHLVGPAEGPNRGFTSFPEQTAMGMEMLLKQQNYLRAGRENL